MLNATVDEKEGKLCDISIKVYKDRYEMTELSHR